MTFPLLLCVLSALSAGLYFGRDFAEAHRRGQNLLRSVLLHFAVSAVLVALSVWLDGTELGLLWMTVATASLLGLALGALLPRPLVAAAPAPRRGVPAA
ncbi:hypothetical protein [Deinococcus marmoris]|uniref:Uncharacterized protein n=1 Tax=Deinococcus marmoris TaxID=249408 RepID=A0A1U7NWT2_9DEIO|nr:hypothetical protein [Deinococcus marmoris]OLV17372.1 hypothetical protein BOO71_0008851 [Deinococcus marmoris]